MPTRNQIIEDLFTGKNFNDCLSKMNPSGLRDDLRQEVALIVCEMPEEKLVKLHTDKGLVFYVVRVIVNMACSNKSPFHKKFRQIFVELNPNILQ